MPDTPSSYLPDGTWHCVWNHRTTPCGVCDGCRYVQSLNLAGLTGYEVR